LDRSAIALVDASNDSGDSAHRCCIENTDRTGSHWAGSLPQARTPAYLLCCPLQTGSAPSGRPLREIKAVQRGALPIDVHFVGGPTVVVGVAAVQGRRSVARERRVAPVTPDRDGPAVRLGKVVRLGRAVGTSRDHSGKIVRCRPQRREPVVKSPP